MVVGKESPCRSFPADVVLSLFEFSNGHAGFTRYVNVHDLLSRGSKNGELFGSGWTRIAHGM